MEIQPINKYVKIMGRTLLRNNELYLCFSGVYVEFLFSGNLLEVEFYSDVTMEEEAAWIAVYSNGKLENRIKLQAGSHTYSIYNSTKVQGVTIRLLKLSEEQYATCSIRRIVTDDEAVVTPTPLKDTKIEFIGDSITCGYGNEGIDGEQFTTSTENVAKAYAVICAEKLGADFELVSWSGIGIISRYIEADENTPKTDILMPKIYPYTDWYLSQRKNWKYIEKWNFTKHQANVVVINLGTNDASYVRNEANRKKAFEDKYIRFLKTVRHYQKVAYIICLLGIMDQNLCDSVEEVVDRYRCETRDERIAYFRQPQQVVEDGIGIDGHPSMKTHEKMADQLIQKIKAVLSKI